MFVSRAVSGKGDCANFNASISFTTYRQLPFSLSDTAFKNDSDNLRLN
jgi:hypothetical protein